jgi:hypothetical protein
VKDTFDIFISVPEHISAINSSVYYLDANLYSGKKLIHILGEHADEYQHALFIGISNRGRTKHEFRKRDYIPPVLRNGDTITTVKGRSNHYGHADLFYSFLTRELIPYIDSTYKTKGSRTLIGHSLGGLFVMYSLFKENRQFDNFISLSPGLWVNKYNIFQYLRQLPDTTVLNNYLYLSSGKREIFNFILAGNRRMRRTMMKLKFSGLKMEYAEHARKKHDTQVAVSLKYLFTRRIFK